MQRPYEIKSYNSYKKSSPKLRVSGHPNLARLIATENSYFKCMFIKKHSFGNLVQYKHSHREISMLSILS